MAKSLDEQLAANPKAKRHERVIRETLKALDQLREAGFGDAGYDLEPPYGGNREPQEASSRKRVLIGKMTYCA